MSDASYGEPLLEVVSAGPLVSIQDAGRPGFKRRGVPVSGGMDMGALEWANRLVGNLRIVPSLEVLFGGFRFRVLRRCRIGIAGPAGIGRISPNSSDMVEVGEEFTVEPRAPGVWSYLAVPGGFRAETFLGSSSTYLRGGIGTVPAPGDRLYAGSGGEGNGTREVGVRFVDPAEVVDYGAIPQIRIWKGPQWESFPVEVRKAFAESAWQVSNESDRVGYRLEGPVLRGPSGNMISEPVGPGTVQVPPSGQPVVLMRDAPTIGGYPKIGIVEPEALSRLAQVAPGGRFFWQWCDED